MFEITDLKAKKLPELQEIAKGIEHSKIQDLKKIGFGLPNLGCASIQPICG